MARQAVADEFGFLCWRQGEAVSGVLPFPIFCKNLGGWGVCPIRSGILVNVTLRLFLRYVARCVDVGANQPSGGCRGGAHPPAIKLVPGFEHIFSNNRMIEATVVAKLPMPQRHPFHLAPLRKVAPKLGEAAQFAVGRRK